MLQSEKTSKTTPYEDLETRFTELHRLGHAQALLNWDEAVMMPRGGGAARGEALATLAGLTHRALTAPDMGDLLDAAGADAACLDAWQQANLRAMRRMHTRATALPEALVREMQRAAAHCNQIWREARHENDWLAIQEPLADVSRLAREEAAALGEALALAPYDALLDGYEEGTRADDVAALFGDLKDFLPPLIERVIDTQQEPLPLGGYFPRDRQRALSETMMRKLGFDFTHGRFDVSHHPFCGGVPDDTRITTRYSEENFLESLMAVLHETGHALYQQGLPAAWRSQPVGDSLGAAVHESQSLLIEMQMSRGRPFIAFAAPHLCHHMKGDRNAAWEPDNLYAHCIKVRRGYIRVDADELTYPLHVILRFELERALIAGDLDVADMPEAWNARMIETLGLSTDGNFKDGCMQDVHWFSGLFGYFPTYTLGTLMAAQLYATVRTDLPDLDTNITAGDFTPLLAWLREKIHGRGQLMTATELLIDVTGEPLNAAHFKTHLKRRYLKV